MTDVRHDGWMSSLTQIGTLKDPRTTYTFWNGKVLEPEEATRLYNFYDLAARICELPVEESLSSAWNYLCPDDEELGEALLERVRELNAVSQFADAAVWGRVHGDCFLYMSVEDGRGDDQPLGVVRRLNFVRKVERTFCTPVQWYADLRKPNFGQPSHFQVRSTSAHAPMVNQQVVHESRFLKFYGARTSQEDLVSRSGWHFSVLQRPYDVLRDFGVGWANAGLMLSQSTQGIYQVANLMHTLSAPNGPQKLSERMAAIDMARGALKSIMLDAGDPNAGTPPETFRYEVAPLAGLADILDRYAGRLSSAAGGIPITKLFGISPAGLNATGEHDSKNWANILDAYRRDRLQPEIWRFTEVLLQEMKREGVAWSLRWPELEAMSDLEIAQAKLVVAQTDVAYVTAMVLSPAEVAVQRFAGVDAWKADIVVDMDARHEDGSLLETDAELEAADADAQAAEGDKEHALDLVDATAKGAPREDSANSAIKKGPRGGSYTVRHGKKYYVKR